jgi:hypothetical protein
MSRRGRMGYGVKRHGVRCGQARGLCVTGARRGRACCRERQRQRQRQQQIDEAPAEAAAEAAAAASSAGADMSQVPRTRNGTPPEQPMPRELRKAALFAVATGIIGAAIGELLSGVLGDKANAGTGGAIGSLLGLTSGLLFANRISTSTVRWIVRLGHAFVLAAGLFLTVMALIAFVACPEPKMAIALAICAAVITYVIIQLRRS